MKLFNIKTGEEIAEIDENEITSVSRWLDTFDDETYDKIVEEYTDRRMLPLDEANLIAAKIEVSYGFYKYYRGANPVEGSYNETTKNIQVWCRIWGGFHGIFGAMESYEKIMGRKSVNK